MTTSRLPPDEAATLLRHMVQPRIGKDPTGVLIEAQTSHHGPTLLIRASSENMPQIVGSGGTMIKALRILFTPFGYRATTSDFADSDAFSPIPKGDISIPAVASAYLDALTGNQPEMTGNATTAEWFIDPVFFRPELAAAFNSWAFLCGRAQDLKIRYRLLPADKPAPVPA